MATKLHSIEDITTKRLTAREKIARDDLIVEARLRGRSWISIAAEHDLSDRCWCEGSNPRQPGAAARLTRVLCS